MALTAASLLHASSFTLGCMTIHALRSYADRLTPILIYLAIILVVAVTMVGTEHLLAEHGARIELESDLSQAL